MSGISRELPDEAVGPACAVFVYSAICLTLSSMLLWATLAHRESKSYVALLAFFTSLSTAASMAQQLHTCFRWTTIQLEQFDYVKINIENPELSIAGASVGLDLVLFYIQFYSYNVESILVASWCTQLAHSVFRLKASRSTSRYGSHIAKTAAILLPAAQVSLMRTKIVQQRKAGFYFVANIIMGVSLAVGIILLLAILLRYVATRAEMSWHLHYGCRSTTGDGTAITSGAGNGSDLASLSDVDTRPLYRKSIYDNWLLIRFTIAFAGLAAFQLIVLMQQVAFRLGNMHTMLEKTVDLTPRNAIVDIESFLPGVSASVLAFIVFGTTKTFRDFFYAKLVPRSIRRKIRAKRNRPSVANAAVVLPAAKPRKPVRPDSDILASPVGCDVVGPLSARSECFEGPLSARSECFELEGREVWRHTGTGLVCELVTPTTTHSTFDLQKKGQEEEEWPILPNRPATLTMK